jgi:serine/threonine protein phosphatase PrpC
MSEHQAKYVNPNTDDNLSKCVEKLFEDILAPNTDEGIGTDNMTCILIKLYNKDVKKE